ncbi:MAG: hypothetical protein JWN34_5319 [Bryobacterales bacterium]|nr:hypothetical protein [Bryobacterales bacterium]
MSVEASERSAQVDLSVYSSEAVLKSAYRFTGRCYVVLQRVADEMMSVRIRPKNANEDPDAVLGEFLNDLLDQRLRSLIAAETVTARDLVLRHALSKAKFIRPDLEVVDPAIARECASEPEGNADSTT